MDRARQIADDIAIGACPLNGVSIRIGVYRPQVTLSDGMSDGETLPYPRNSLTNNYLDGSKIIEWG